MDSSDYQCAHSLANNRVLLTGASGGIGAVTAKTLAAAGAYVYLHYQNSEQIAQTTLTEIQNIGGDGCCIQADLNSESSIRDLFQKMEESKGVPNMLVNMAARQDVQSFESMSLDDWQNMMRVNQDAAFLLMRYFCDIASSINNSAIVNVASIEGLDPALGHSHYASSKAALIMMTRAVAVEMGEKGIRVNAVSPGLIDRPNLEQDWPDGYQRWQSRCPLNELGQAQDVAYAICFLLSPAAKWINGTNLVVDGGMSARDRW